MKKSIIFVLALLLSACAIDKPIADNRVLAYQTPEADRVKVEIQRKNQFAGLACYLGVMYEETLIARIGSGEKATVYLPKGSGLFTVRTDPDGKGLCGVQGVPDVVRKIKLEDKDNVLETGFTGFMFLYIKPKQ